MIIEAELGFRVSMETTLAEYKKILEELTSETPYMYGEEEAIEFFADGEIICHEIEDEYVPSIIKIADSLGYWPWINLYCQSKETPDMEICKIKLAEFGNDYGKLWDWIKMECIEMEDEE